MKKSKIYLIILLQVLLLIMPLCFGTAAVAQAIQGSSVAAQIDSAPVHPEKPKEIVNASVAKGHEDPFSLGRVVRTIVSLIFVCALAILLLGKVVPRLNFERFGKSRGEIKHYKKKLRVVERLILDRKNYLAVVSLGESSELLISVGEQGVSTLGEIDKTGSFEQISSGLTLSTEANRVRKSQ